MNTFEELRAKAADMELAQVNFRGADGKVAKSRRAVRTAEFIFIDGVRMVLHRSETDRPGFDALSFKLRPSKSN